MTEITEKEGKEMFPQGLPRDFVKQVYLVMLMYMIVKVLVSQIEVARKAQWLVRPAASTIFNGLDQYKEGDSKPRYLLCIVIKYVIYHF